MGRKIDMKKIEDVTKCQVTFSKRRSSLMKKANEIAVVCDVDIAFVAFSPSGRVSKFSNQKRIEEVLHRYVSLPAEKRLTHINNVEQKLEKLKHLSHINGDTSKLQYLDKQIENLELQIKKRGLELQILETDLRDYELGPDQEPSLHQLSWCERNLNHSLQRVIARKEFIQMKQIELERQPQPPFPSTFNNEIGQVSSIANPTPGQILMQLDPWISPYSARVRDNILQDFFDQTKHTTTEIIGPSNAPNFLMPSNIPNFPIQQPPNFFESMVITTSNVQTIPPPHIPLLQQPLMVDQPLLNYYEQNNVNAWNNNSSAVFSEATPLSTQNLCNIQDPRYTSMITTMVLPNPSRAEMPQPLYDQFAGFGWQCANSTNMSQFSNMDHISSFINGNNRNNDNGGNGSFINGNNQHDNGGKGSFINGNNRSGNGGNNSFINGNNRNDNVGHEDYCRNVTRVNDNGDYVRINCDQMQRSDQIMLQDAYTVHPQPEVHQDAQCNDILLPDQNAHGDNAAWTSKIQKTGLWEWEELLLDENFNLQDFLPKA